MSEPREFDLYIDPDGYDHDICENNKVWTESSNWMKPTIHVIEYTDEIKRKLKLYDVAIKESIYLRELVDEDEKAINEVKRLTEMLAVCEKLNSLLIEGFEVTFQEKFWESLLGVRTKESLQKFSKMRNKE